MGGGSKSKETARNSRRRQVKKGEEEDEANENFKSPNLQAERRRREKLRGRLMALRAHVPIVTNMTQAAIVEDTITYIGKLQRKVESLTMKLDEMEESHVENEMEESHHEIKPQHHDTIDVKEEMKELGIEENVQLCKIGERKFWLKIITEKKAGIFTKFMEAMRFIGFEIIDISLTTKSGAILICSSLQLLQGLCDGDLVDVQQIKDFLFEVMRSNP